MKTPTTDEVRFRYTEHPYLLDEGEGDPEEFNRWLAQVKRDAVINELETIIDVCKGSIAWTENNFLPGPNTEKAIREYTNVSEFTTQWISNIDI